MNWETILFIGDSITNGARSYLSFPEYAGDILEKKTGKFWNIINLSKNGITVAELNKLVAENNASLTSGNVSLAVILIGTNDAKARTDEDDFRIAFNQLVIKAKLLSQNKNVAVLKLPLFQNGIMLPYELEMNEQIKRYNLIIGELAKKHQLLLLDPNYTTEHFFDGVHLNKAGAKHFAAQLSELILSKRGI